MDALNFNMDIGQFGDGNQKHGDHSDLTAIKNKKAKAFKIPGI